MTDPCPEYTLRYQRAHRLLVALPLLLFLGFGLGVGLFDRGLHGLFLLLPVSLLVLLAAHAVLLWPAPSVHHQPAATAEMLR